ncbi:MAG: beta-lactamase family protein [Kordiimonadaceae bacterium]|nr:beta-lactamase family protein [Kordiimonadaceae bacterium]
MLNKIQKISRHVKHNTSKITASVGLTIFLAVPLVSTPAAASYEVNQAAIDALVSKSMEEKRIPGVAISVMHKGKMIFAKGYGYANLEHKVKIMPKTLFQSASVGKMFTSSLILLLEQDGKLSLDDKILKHFPNGPKTWENITIRNLMMHRSGIPDFAEDFFGEAGLRKDFNHDELMSHIYTMPLIFAPNTQFSYSNAAYAMLGILVEKLTGKPYGDMLNTRVFGPAGMKNSQVNDIHQIIPHRSQGYIIRDEKLLRDYYVSPTLSQTADGSLLFNVLDMAAWDNALFYANSVLPAKTASEMWKRRPFSDATAQKSGYGYGWGISEVRGHKVYSHSGGWQGFSTYYIHIPAKDLSVVVLANLEGANSGTISKKILGTLDSALASYLPIKDSKPELTSAHQKAVTAYLAGDALGKAFSKKAAKALNGINQKRAITDFKPAVSQEKFELVAVNSKNSSRSYKAGRVIAHISTDKNGLIDSLELQGRY